MTASIEWLDDGRQVGLIRTHADGGKLGDPYTWSIVFVRQGRGCAILKGLYRRPTMEESRAGRDALRREGIFNFTYERVGVPRPRGRSVQL